MNKLPQALVSAPAKEADDTNAHNAHNAHNEHAPAVNSSVEYINNNVVRTDEPAKITDVVFFGIVKGW